ncbi:MAG: DUF1634 domain-containing protein [Thermoplasmatales archaeon]
MCYHNSSCSGRNASEWGGNTSLDEEEEEEQDKEAEEKKEKAENLSSKVLSQYLIWSVIISVSIIIFGTIEFLVTGSSGYVNLPVFVLIKSGGIYTNVFPHYLNSIGVGLIKVKSFAVIEFGILVLILSPIGRMFLQIFIYARERDRNFIIIATSVFLILVFSLYISRFFR